MRYSPSVMGLRFFSRCPVAKADDEGRHKNAQPGAGEGVAGKVIIRTQQTDRDRPLQQHRQRPIPGISVPNHGSGHRGMARRKSAVGDATLGGIEAVDAIVQQ